jgi:Fic family protein
MQLNIPVTSTILGSLTRLDRFLGMWPNHGLPHERLERMAEAARIRSVAASCRLAGMRTTEADVAGLLRGAAVPLRDAVEIRGYDAAIAWPIPGSDQIFGTQDQRQLHAVMLGGGPAAEPSPWRRHQLHREAFDSENHATGRVFATLPPHLVEEKTEELLTWLEIELRSKAHHPVLAIGSALLALLAISPFERGSGRLVRVLAGHLLRRAGYAHIPYASLEAQMEDLRDEHYEAFDLAQTKLWAGEADVTPWLELFARTLDRHRERIEVKLELERNVHEYPPLQQAILQAVREHGSVDAGLLLRATGTNRNTLKDNLRRLVERGVLERNGERRAARYTLGFGGRRPVPPRVEKVPL